MLESYLVEFMWRQRLAGANPYEQIMRDIAEVPPETNHETDIDDERVQRE